ncbi:MAG: vWA domain-containing protein [Verrucomicrobiota bacterium]
MKAHTFILPLSVFSVILGTACLQAAELPKEPAPAKAVQKSDAPASKPRQPMVEVTFVLDTTGSMDGLIDGAKQKIWSIANDIISAKPKPLVRFGLVGYRDRGDAYIIKRASLTDDLDAIHAQLQEFRADGGGDTPESVSEALHEAVTKMPWSTGDDVLKVIYLVGDAPPQAYENGKDWKKVCEKAQETGILINTIQCGNLAGTAEVWKAIASRAAGAYAVIPQDGNMVVIAAPQDEELGRLNAEIGKTLIPWGSESTRRSVTSKQRAAEAAAPADNASRLGYNSKSDKTVQGEGELLDGLKEGKAELDKIKPSELPEELRKLNPAELKAHVEKQQATRSELQARITVLVKERDVFISAERKKRSTSGKTDSFDEQVAQTLRQQAAPKGITWEK